MLRARRVLSLARGRRAYTRSATAPAAADRLRVLFCGSDEFSIYSLRALYNERERDAARIGAIDVVHRPGKRTGRGLKQVREVPIKAAAHALRLPTHEIDTFTGWIPPTPYDLVVAVSFGLFVPTRILDGARYGGLNVHPSLLPDLYGPAPIHHALLRGDSTTGVSVQTLHPKHFDQGAILSQLRVEIPDPLVCTPQRLIDHLGPIGGSMLAQILRERAFMPPVRDLRQDAAAACLQRPRHASKITKEDTHVNFHTWSADRIVRTLRVLGNLWDDTLHSYVTGQADGRSKRVIIHAVRVEEFPLEGVPSPGTWWSIEGHRSMPAIGTVTCDGKVLHIESCTVEGHRKGEGTRLLAHALTQAQRNV